MLEEAVLQLRKDVPLELVVNMFQKLVRSPPMHRTLPGPGYSIILLEPTPYTLLAGRQAHGHGHEDGHRLVAHGRLRSCRRTRCSLRCSRFRACSTVIYRSIVELISALFLALGTLRADYVEVVMEGFAQLPDLECRIRAVEVPPAEVWLAEGEVDEDTSGSQYPGVGE